MLLQNDFETDSIIYLNDYAERWHAIVMAAVIGVFIFAGLFIFSHLLVLHGAVKERAEKECVGAVAISNWEKTLNIAQSICVDTQKSQLSELKNNYIKNACRNFTNKFNINRFGCHNTIRNLLLLRILL